MTPLWRRILALVATVALLAALRVMPLPGLNPDVATPWDLSLPSVGWLGITPWVSAFLLVELFATIVPAWRPLRSSGRGILLRWTVGLWLVFAVLQALSSAYSLEALRFQYAMLVLEPGWSFRWTVVGSMVAASGLTMLACIWNHRYGLTTGLALAWVAGFVLEPFVWWQHVQIGEVVLLVPALVAASAVAMAKLRTPGGRRLTPAGLVPLLWVPTFLYTLATLLEADVLYDERLHLLVLAVVTVVLAVALHPRAWASDRRDFGLAILANTAWLLGLHWMFLHLETPGWGIGLIVLVSFGIDLFTELRARLQGLDHELCVVHGIDEADTLSQRLADEGIPSGLRGDATRALLQFFGPHLPVGVLVTPSDRERAASAPGS